MTFETFALDARLLDGVREMGYTTPTPIQEQAIPHALEGLDIVGCAQTGTGKTAAFILPTLHRIGATGRIKALVVTPTRELAVQIEQVALACTKHTGQHVAAVYGGVKYETQLKKLKHGVDLLVATPGRLLDLQNRGHVDLRHVEVLVLDEADRMLDMGFWPDVRKILRLLPTPRQNLLFSATMSADVLRIVSNTLREPVRVEVGPQAMPVDAIYQAIYPVDAMQKPDLLAALIERNGWDRVLVFTKTKQRADFVWNVLSRKGISCEVMHADRRQSQREKALEGFREGSIQVLIATDIVARGIDVEGISHVVNYEVPENTEDYVHRVGRTARAGATGTAITLLSAEDIALLPQLERAVDQVLPVEDLEGFPYRDRIIPREDRDPAKQTRRMFASGGRRGGGRRRR